MMGVLLFALLMMSSAFASPGTEVDPEQICEEIFSDSSLKNLSEISGLLNQKFLKPTNPYYFYLETDELEDLQAFKNCIDYSQCGKYQESIVDDPKNFRMHIWKSMTASELTELVKSCPVKDIAKKLVVRKKDQTGSLVSVKDIKPDEIRQKIMLQDANPAMFIEPNESYSKNKVEVIHSMLRQEKVNDAQKMILKTWNINLHGYNLKYTGEKGSFAVTHHKEKTIKYGKDWLSEPCDYIRMIRHEAEHVAQIRMSNSCYGNHNLSDHKRRERAAHLNDARFIKNVCGPLKAGETVRQFCLNRFRKNYMNK